MGRRKFPIKHFCQCCCQELPRMELDDRVLDACTVIIQKTTLRRFTPISIGKEPVKYKYTKSCRRDASYTVCNACAARIGEQLAALIPHTRVMEVPDE